jgi:hypothetical protein
MKEAIAHQCDIHPDPFVCPDHLIIYIPRFDEYGIVVHDGTHSYVAISYCPWCGTCLPTSKRDEWFRALESLGYDDPLQQDIPGEYTGDHWWSGDNTL